MVPFFEPRAVASVPRTIDRFRSLPSFRNDKPAISGSVLGTLATARGSRNGDQRTETGRSTEIRVVPFFRPSAMTLRFQAPSVGRSRRSFASAERVAGALSDPDGTRVVK